MPNEKVIGINQPLPAYTLLDLQQDIEAIYQANLHLLKNLADVESNAQARALLQSAIEGAGQIRGRLIKLIEQNDSIGMPFEVDAAMLKAVNMEEIQFTVSGLQLLENRVVTGTCLYSTMPKAKTIRDICNAKFAELNVDKLARIQQYPVY